MSAASVTNMKYAFLLFVWYAIAGWNICISLLFCNRLIHHNRTLALGRLLRFYRYIIGSQEEGSRDPVDKAYYVDKGIPFGHLYWWSTENKCWPFLAFIVVTFIRWIWIQKNREIQIIRKYINTEKPKMQESNPVKPFTLCFNCAQFPQSCSCHVSETSYICVKEHTTLSIFLCSQRPPLVPPAHFVLLPG